MSDTGEPPPGVRRHECDLCGGYDDVLADGTVIQYHRNGCPNFVICGCGEPDCVECEENHSAHLFDPGLMAIGLRLLIAAIDEDTDGVTLALDDIPDCPNCERTVWLAVLRVAGHYGTEDFADVLRKELLEVLDADEKNRQARED